MVTKYRGDDVRTIVRIENTGNEAMKYVVAAKHSRGGYTFTGSAVSKDISPSGVADIHADRTVPDDAAAGTYNTQVLIYDEKTKETLDETSISSTFEVVEVAGPLRAGAIKTVTIA